MWGGEKKVILKVTTIVNVVKTVEFSPGCVGDGAIGPVNVRDVVARFMQLATAPAEVAGLFELGGTFVWWSDVHGI